MPNWRDWDPDIESSALQVVMVVVLASEWHKSTLSYTTSRKALHLELGLRAPSNSEEETQPTSAQRIELAFVDSDIFLRQSFVIDRCDETGFDYRHESDDASYCACASALILISASTWPARE